MGSFAGLTQLVECQLPKLDVAGSNPVPRSLLEGDDRLVIAFFAFVPGSVIGALVRFARTRAPKSEPGTPLSNFPARASSLLRGALLGGSDATPTVHADLREWLR
jgi:hypothetical protein